MKKGGPAFPTDGGKEYFVRNEGEFSASPGMTLRDYFASMALMGGCAKDGLGHILRTGQVNDAYELADEMLKAREVKS